MSNETTKFFFLSKKTSSFKFKETLDLFCDSFIKLFEQVQLGNIEKFLNSPQRAPWLRLDEVHAGRSLNLRWTSLD